MSSLDEETLRLENKRLREALEKLQAPSDTFRMQIGEKGGISIYGLGQRFPITAYAKQWLIILDHADEIRAFIVENNNKLSWK